MCINHWNCGAKRRNTNLKWWTRAIHNQSKERKWPPDTTDLEISAFTLLNACPNMQTFSSRRMEFFIKKQKRFPREHLNMIFDPEKSPESCRPPAYAAGFPPAEAIARGSGNCSFSPDSQQPGVRTAAAQPALHTGCGLCVVCSSRSCSHDQKLHK